MAAISATQLLVASSAAQGANSVVSSINAAGATKASARYQKFIADQNVKYGKMAEEDAIRRGDLDAAKIHKDKKRVIGSQRAAFAAQGIDVGEGSALDVQEDTDLIGTLDMIKTKNNAYREAFGYKIQSSQDTLSGKLAKIQGDTSARSSLVTGGLNAARSGLDAFYQYKKA